MGSAAQQQQLAPAPAVITTTTTTTTTSSSSSSSILGKGHVEEENAVEAVVVRSGLVSLRRGEGEQRPRLRPGQEAAVKAVEEEGEAQGEGEGEGKMLAPEQKSLDAQVDWTIPVEWIGTVRERNVAGADVGNRLYAGKKRMFKGHKWERMRERRVRRTEMLLRDMDKRIERFKGVRSIFSTRLRKTILPLPIPPPPFFFLT
jgi:hypothetical protein